MADAETAPAEKLAVEAARIDDRADIADGEKIDQRRLARFDVDFDFGKARDKRVRVAVVRVVVFGDAHQAQSGERRAPMLS